MEGFKVGDGEGLRVEGTAVTESVFKDTPPPENDNDEEATEVEKDDDDKAAVTPPPPPPPLPLPPPPPFNTVFSPLVVVATPKKACHV
jgi:hypothetical protein